MSSVVCSFCSKRFATFNLYIVHMADGECGEKRRQDQEAEKRKNTTMKIKISDKLFQKRKRSDDSSQRSSPPAKKTITATMVPQQKARVPSAAMIKNGKMRCEFCMKMMKPRGMTQHLNLVHKCVYCGELVENMQNHLAIHEVESCEHCDKKFLDKSKVEIHVKHTHLEKCEECGEIFYSQSSMSAHIQYVHESEHCDFCDERIRKADSSLDDHKEKQHGIKKKVMKEFGGGMMFMMMAE